MNKLVLGNHYLIDFYECSKEVLTNLSKIKEIMLSASKIGNLQMLDLF